MGTQEKVALVTGASRGIGKAIALALGEEGFKIAVNYRSNAKYAEEVVETLRQKKVEAIAVKADVSNADEVEEMFINVEKTLGVVQVLVNNAGITKDNLLMRMKNEEWDDVIKADLYSVFFTTKRAIRPMLKTKWGRIVNVSSVIGLIGNKGQANYAAAKAGIIGFTKSSARELASRGITVNAIAPGFIETDMTAVLPEEIKNGMLAQIPAGRFGKTEDVANLVRFLCADYASYITGQVIAVDGGMTMV